MKKGISLVALVITIVVLIILTGTVILTTFDNGLLDRSEEAVFKNNVKTFLEDYTNVKLKKRLEDYNIDLNSIEASNSEGNIKEWIPSITEDFIDRIYIQKGIFKADKAKYTEKELVWLEQIGIEMGIAPVIGTTDMWQLDDTKTVITAYLGENIFGGVLTIPNKVKDSSTGEVYAIKEVGEGIFNNKRISCESLVISSNLTFLSDISKGIFPICLYVEDNVTFKSGLECYRGTTNINSFYKISIGDNVRIEGIAFRFNYYLNKLEIGNNFYCNNLSSLTFLNVLEEVTIGDNATLPQTALSNNNVLKRVNIGKGLNILEPNNDINRFLNSNPVLEEVNIASFKNLGGNALRDCTLLEKVVLEDGGIISGAYAFGDCTGIKEVVLGNVDMSSTSATNTFKGCTGIEKVTIKKGAGEKLKASLFNGNTNIKEVIIEDNATLKISMFARCTGLTNLTIGNNVTVANAIFNQCTGLTNITIPGSTNLTDAVGIFINCTGLQSVQLGQGLNAISTTMFKGCTNLQSIEIPNSVKSIGSNAFANCSGLTSIKIPSGVESIETYAFANCSNLSDVKIASSVREIETKAFSNCTNLTTITVGSDAVKTLVEASGYTGTVVVDTSIN